MLKDRRFIWSNDRLRELQILIAQGLSNEEIGKRLGVSVNAILVSRKRYGIKSRTESILSPENLAERMGIGCAKSIAAWIRKGYLKATRGQFRGKNQQWYIADEDLLQFLSDPKNWHLYNPERFKDVQLQQYCLRIRGSARFLSIGEVEKRTGINRRQINKYIHQGKMKAVRNGNWQVGESDLEDFLRKRN